MKRALVGKIAAVSTAGVLSVGGIALATSGGGTASAAGATPAASTSTAKAAAPAAKAKAKARLGLAKRVVHGDFTAKTKDGYANFDGQRGTVTALSPTSVTLKSPDGFTAVYTVTKDSIVRVGKDKSTIGAVKVGEKAVVLAKDASGAKTVTHLLARAG